MFIEIPFFFLETQRNEDFKFDVKGNVMDEPHLSISMGVILNLSEHWKSCTLEYRNRRIVVSPIPPKTSRPLPSSGEYRIVNEEILAQVPSRLASLCQPITITRQATYRGSISLPDLTAEISIQIVIMRGEIIGWFFSDTCYYLIHGLCSNLSEDTSFSCYSSAGKVYRDIHGKVGSSQIFANCNQGSFDLSLDESTVLDLVADDEISGEYTGYYQKSANSYELAVDMDVKQNGVIMIRGTENGREFEMFGALDRANQNGFAVRLKGNETVFCFGPFHTTDDIYHEGMWTSSLYKGNYALFRG